MLGGGGGRLENRGGYYKRVGVECEGLARSEKWRITELWDSCFRVKVTPLRSAFLFLPCP